MKMKRIYTIIIFIAVFCIINIRNAEASDPVCSSENGYKKCSVKFGPDDGGKEYKYIDVQNKSFAFNDNDKWYEDYVAKNWRSTIQAADDGWAVPTNPFDPEKKPPIKVAEGSSYSVDCQTNEYGIPCNNPDIRLVLMIVKTDNETYQWSPVGDNGASLIQKSNNTFYYGLKVVSDTVKIVRLNPVDAPDYKFTDYKTIETDMVCNFNKNFTRKNSIDTITLDNPGSIEINVTAQTEDVPIECSIPLPEGETVVKPDSFYFILMWSKLSEAIKCDGTSLYVAYPLAFHWYNGYPNYSIKTTDLIGDTFIVFTVLYEIDAPLPDSPPDIGTFTTTPSNYNIEFSKAHYSTVVKFDLDLPMCPDDKTPIDEKGDCADSLCSEQNSSKPEWDIETKKCIPVCDDGMLNTGYELKDDKSACTCKNSKYPNKNDGENRCEPDCNGGTIKIKNNDVVCTCPTGWTLNDDTCEVDLPDGCSSDSNCPYGYECKDSECVEKEMPCQINTQCINEKICQDGICIDGTPADSCNTNADCESDMVCKSWICQEPSDSNKCSSNSDCDGNEVCQGGSCISGSNPAATCTGQGQATGGSGKCICQSGWICSSKDTSGNCLCTQGSGPTNTCSGLGQISDGTGHCACLSGWECTKNASNDCLCTQTDPTDECGGETGKVKDSTTGSCICDALNGYFLIGATGQCVKVVTNPAKVAPSGCAIIGVGTSLNGSFGFIIPLITVAAIRLRRKFFS